MKTVFGLIFLGSFCFVFGCSAPPTSDEGSLVEEAFEAIKENDWDRYGRLLITPADFILARQKIGPFQARQTYAGGVLKPEQRRRQQEQFLRAVSGGPGQISFQDAEFEALGTLAASRELELLEGDGVPLRCYSLRIRLFDKIVDTRELGPFFLIVDWGRQFRLIGLEFPGHQPQSQSPGTD